MNSVNDFDVQKALFEYLKSSDLKSHYLKEYKNNQTLYISKRMRESVFYKNLDKNQRTVLDKKIKAVIDEYCKVEECDTFSIFDLYNYLIKIYYDRS